jgi:bisphosphoglycerate-independent phosphoglycerate mutase (AlkP superfamily)
LQLSQNTQKNIRLCSRVSASISIETTIANEVSLAGLRQAHIAETEKFPHATYFLNGGKEEPHDGEEHVMLAE